MILKSPHFFPYLGRQWLIHFTLIHNIACAAWQSHTSRARAENRHIFPLELVHTALLRTRSVRDLRACACVSTPARVRVRVACLRLCQLRLCLGPLRLCLRLGPLRLCLRLSLHLCACDPVSLAQESAIARSVVAVLVAHGDRLLGLLCRRNTRLAPHRGRRA